MTDPLDLDALEATARAATPFVRYEIDDPNACFIAGTDPGDDDAQIVISDVYDETVAAHIAAFDPPTVLALIERVREAEREMHARELHHFEEEQARAEAEAVITRVRNMHFAKSGETPRYAPGDWAQTGEPTHWEKYTICNADGTTWPCSTIRALDGDQS